MQQITIALNGKSPEEIEQMNGVVMSVNWDSLIPVIGEAVRLRPDEVIDGLIINDVDIRVSIGRKKGRKGKN